MTGVSGLAGDPAYPPKQPPMPPLPLGKIRRAVRPGDEPARLALVAVGHHGRHHRVRRAGAVHQSRPLHAGLRAGRQGEHRHHLLAARDPRRRGTAHALPGARDHHRTSTAWRRASIYYDAEGVEQFQPAEVVIMACNGVGTPRLLLNSASGGFPNGLANSSGLVGKNLMFHPYAQVYGYVDEPLDGNRAPPLCLWSKEFYETDPRRDFVRGYTFQFGRGIGPVTEAIISDADGPRCPGARAITAPSANWSAAASACRRSARTCRRSTTGSRSIRC